MRNPLGGGIPELQEETRAARGRTFELLLSVVLLSTLIGLALNLGAGLLLQALTQFEALILVVGSLALALVALIIFVPRASTTVKEFHEEIELFLPLVVTAQDVEVLQVARYSPLDVAHDALKRRPDEERRLLAEHLRSSHGKSGVGHLAVKRFALETTQLMLAVEAARRSRQLLGDEAEYHKVRQIARMQPAIVSANFAQVTAQAGDNLLFQGKSNGLPEKALLPEHVRLRLPSVARQLKALGARRRGEQKQWRDITLFAAEAGRDTAFRITAVADYSEHGIPTRQVPRRGLTARAILRNAENQRIRELAREEEDAAERLDPSGRTRADDPETVALVERHGAAYQKLYAGNTRPRLLRVFVRFDGAFRIRLLAGQRRQRAIYAWATALAQLLAQSDIEVFMAQLKEAGQKTPTREF
jgi:hypothetical protein